MREGRCARLRFPCPGLPSHHELMQLCKPACHRRRRLLLLQLPLLFMPWLRHKRKERRRTSQMQDAIHA